MSQSPREPSSDSPPNKTAEPGAYLTVAEAADILGVSERSVRAEIHDGRLPALCVRGRFRIAAPALAALAFTPADPLVAPRRLTRRRPSKRFAELNRGMPSASLIE